MGGGGWNLCLEAQVYFGKLRDMYSTVWNMSNRDS